jgi:hypothetical protein
LSIIRQCGISDTDEFRSLWRLPALPLTERFGPHRPSADLSHDQELLISIPTGHVQLRHQVDPKLLYADGDYAFRTGSSEKSRQGVAFFLDFVAQVAGGQTFQSIVDVGGNDLFVARALAPYGARRAVIDPICADRDGQEVDGVRVFGRFIEELDLGRDLGAPDLVVCRHTLEHIAQPRAVLRQWMKECRSDCLYLVEIPCLDSMIEAQRFDAVVHQHLHYFDLDAFRHLVWECGGEYLAHAFNRQGSCGGALLVAFRKARSVQPRPTLDLAARITRLERRITRYRAQMEIMAELLDELPTPLYGYGASLMLATLGYHLRTDFSRLAAVLDDDPAKDGLTYENVPVTVRHTAMVAPPPDSSYVVTSLENVRPIYRRLLDLRPRRILVPLVS